MGRSPKRSVDFYRTFSNHTENEKIKLLYKDCGGEGYWIWKCLLDVIFSEEGYFFDLKDEEKFELLCMQCKHDEESVMHHFQIFIKRKLFDSEIFRKHKILTAKRVQENFFYATLERRKKGAQIPFITELILAKPDNPVGLKYVKMEDFSREQSAMRENSSREQSDVSRESNGVSREQSAMRENSSREKSASKSGGAAKKVIKSKKSVKILPGKNEVMAGKPEELSVKGVDLGQANVDNTLLSREIIDSSREKDIDSTNVLIGSNEFSKENSKREHSLSGKNGSEKPRRGAQTTATQGAAENGVDKKSAGLHADEKSLQRSFSELVLAHGTTNETEWRSNWNTLMQFICDNQPGFAEPYVAIWNLFAAKYGLSPVLALNGTRHEKFKQRFTGPQDFITILNNIQESKFLRGGGENRFKVSWDFIFKNEENYLKVLEKQYT